MGEGREKLSPASKCVCVPFVAFAHHNVAQAGRSRADFDG